MEGRCTVYLLIFMLETWRRRGPHAPRSASAATCRSFRSPFSLETKHISPLCPFSLVLPREPETLTTRVHVAFLNYWSESSLMEQSECDLGSFGVFFFLLAPEIRYLSPPFHFSSILWSSAKYRWVNRKHTVLSPFLLYSCYLSNKTSFCRFCIVPCILCSI